MSVRRRRRGNGGADDSLDLLLDTMCNAFGGIVLIAISVALLVEKPGEDKEVAEGVKEDAKLLEKKQRELDELKPLVGEIESELDKTGELIELIRERDLLAAALEDKRKNGLMTTLELDNKLNEAKAKKAAEEKRARDLEKEIAAAEAKEESLKKQLEEIEEQEKDLVDSRQKELRPPLKKEAGGIQITFIVRYDEVFPVEELQFSNSGSLTGAGLNEKMIRWSGPKAEVIQSKGFSIQNDRAKINAYLSKLSNINRKNQGTPDKMVYVASIVFADSFDTVTEFQSMVAQAGNIEDGWEPWPDGQPINFGAGGSSIGID